MIDGRLPRDIRYAARLLIGTPGFTLAAILTLALGIGANIAKEIGIRIALGATSRDVLMMVLGDGFTRAESITMRARSLARVELETTGAKNRNNCVARAKLEKGLDRFFVSLEEMTRLAAREATGGVTFVHARTSREAIIQTTNWRVIARLGASSNAGNRDVIQEHDAHTFLSRSHVGCRAARGDPAAG